MTKLLPALGAVFLLAACTTPQGASTDAGQTREDLMSGTPTVTVSGSVEARLVGTTR